MTSLTVSKKWFSNVEHGNREKPHTRINAFDATYESNGFYMKAKVVVALSSFYDLKLPMFGYQFFSGDKEASETHIRNKLSIAVRDLFVDCGAVDGADLQEAVDAIAADIAIRYFDELKVVGKLKQIPSLIIVGHYDQSDCLVDDFGVMLIESLSSLLKSLEYDDGECILPVVKVDHQPYGERMIVSERKTKKPDLKLVYVRDDLGK